MSEGQVMIAIDAMGGENSPYKVLKGVEIFLQKEKNVRRERHPPSDRQLFLHDGRESLPRHQMHPRAPLLDRVRPNLKSARTKRRTTTQIAFQIQSGGRKRRRRCRFPERTTERRFDQKGVKTVRWQRRG